MFDIEKLKEMCRSPFSGVSVIKKRIHLALEPSYLSDINYGVLKCLDRTLNEYYPELSGILLGYEDVKLKKSTGAVFNDQPHIHIDIKARFYVFRPSSTQQLIGVVNKKSKGHVGILVHDTFNATAINSGGNWAGDSVTIGRPIRFKVVSVSYNSKRPIILGELDPTSMYVDDKPLGIIEQVSDFEGDSDHDSGIENGHNSKKQSQTNTEKRKREDDSGVVQSSSKKLKKNAKEVKSQQGSENETEELVKGQLRQDNAKVMTTVKKTMVEKTVKDKDKFELPPDFEVIEKKTEKNSWKIYKGPDGKNYRSLAEIKKYLDSKQFDSEKLDVTIDYVASQWNMNPEGGLSHDDSVLYQFDSRDFPKTNTFFVDAKDTAPVAASPKIAKENTSPSKKISGKKNEKKSETLINSKLAPETIGSPLASSSVGRNINMSEIIEKDSTAQGELNSTLEAETSELDGINISHDSIKKKKKKDKKKKKKNKDKNYSEYDTSEV